MQLAEYLTTLIARSRGLRMLDTIDWWPTSQYILSSNQLQFGEPDIERLKQFDQAVDELRQEQSLGFALLFSLRPIEAFHKDNLQRTAVNFVAFSLI